MVDREKIIADYDTIKKRALTFFSHNDLEKCLSTIESAVFLANNFNLFYADEEIEDITRRIGEKFKNQESSTPAQEKIVFFDSFGLDNRGLTQQYLRALMSHNIHFVYILAKEGSSVLGKNIQEELNAYKNAEVVIIPHTLSKVEKISKLFQIIDKASPTKILTHRTPGDTVGNAVFSNVHSAEIFHINLTDHAFWLGKNAANYFIEFRSYGANISIAERRIDPNKLLLLPYYPIVSDIPFEGFPDYKQQDPIVLFTGSNYYKMYGENGKFFSLVKEILNENQNTILLIAGSGHPKPLLDFITSNRFQERILLIGDRKDINSVFKHIDIYLATYPITGGLMAQYAALNHKPMVAYTDPELTCNIVEELVELKDHQITYFDENSYLQEIKKLVSDVDYRNNVSTKMAKGAITPEDFNDNFYSVIFDKKLIRPFKSYRVNINRFADVYLDAENNFLRSYDSIIYRYFKSVGKNMEFKFYPAILRHVSKAIKRKMK